MIRRNQDRRRTTLVLGMVIVLGMAGIAGLSTAAIEASTSTVDPGAKTSASPDGIVLASPHPAGIREVSHADAWGGPRSGTESTLSDRVVSYNIDASLDPEKHMVKATEKVSWKNRSHQEVRAVYLHLYLNAFEGPGSTYMTESRLPGFSARDEVAINPGEWGHIELSKVTQGDSSVPWIFVHPDGGPQTDHTVVRLDLPKAVAAGESTTLDIAFIDQLPRVLARTGYYGTFHLIGQWFPKIGVLELPGERGATQVQWNVHEFHLNSEFYADYGLFDVKLTVPSAFTVGAVGEEQGDPVDANGMSTHHYVQADVHDFAWTADSRTAKPLEGEYRGEGSPVVKVKVLYPPEYAVDGPPALKAAIDSLAYFSRTLGPYPYKTVTVVVPPYNASAAGGMEYPTFFTADHYPEPDPGSLQAFALDFVTIHEFGHGYFYGILGSNEFEEPMLDEGLNEYWDMRMLRERNQPVSLSSRTSMRLGATPTLSGFEFEAISAMRADPADGTGANSWDRYNSFSYGTVYFRTSTVMHDLEEAVGKEALERAFHEYYRRWKFRHPSIADLRETLAEVTGQRALVEHIFDQQVYATEKMDDGIASFSSTEDLPMPGTSEVNGKWVEVTQKEADTQEKDARKAWKKDHPNAKPGTGPFAFRTTLTLRHHGVAEPQQVIVKFADGSTESVRWDTPARWQRFEWVKPVKAVSAEIDPEHKHLLDSNVLDNSYALEPDKSASRKWSAGVESIIQTILSLVAAV